MTEQLTERQRVQQYKIAAGKEAARLPSNTLQTLLNLLLCSWFMQECIDALRGTTYDAKGLKMRMNQLEPELKKSIDRDLDLLWGVDDSAMYALQDGVKMFFSDFATMRPEQLAGFHELFKKFKERPDETMAALDVKIVESADAKLTADLAYVHELLVRVKDISSIKTNLHLIIQNQINKEKL